MSSRGTGRRLAAVLCLVVAAAGLTAERDCTADEPAPPPVKPGGEAAPPSPADPDEAAPEALQTRIDAAIVKGVEWLKKRQDKEGSWGNLKQPGAKTYTGGNDGYDEPAGPTALALYVLLKCDVPVADPVVRKGFEWLKKNLRLGGTAYETSAILLAVTATADPFKKVRASRAAEDKVRLVGEWRSWATDLVKKLLSLRSRQGWRYWGGNDARGGGPQDTSSTQFATLALLAADRCDLPIPAAAWTGAIDGVLGQQTEDGVEHPRAVRSRPTAKGAAPAAKGAPPAPPEDESAQDRARGFAYILTRGVEEYARTPTGAMTACGMGTLLMARYVLTKRHAKAWAALDAAAIQTSIYDGFAWLDLHWHASKNPGSKDYYDVYYLYCVERAMDLVGAARLGRRLWYVEMAEPLVGEQKENGSWNSMTTHANSPVLDTSFALLFLQRATRGGIPFPTVTGGSDDPPTDGG